MTVAPQGEQNPAYSPGSLFYKEFRQGGTPLFLSQEKVGSASCRLFLATFSVPLYFALAGKVNVLVPCVFDMYM